MNETSEKPLTTMEEAREREGERIRELIRSEFQAELKACRDLHAVVIDVVERRDRELSAPVGTSAGPTVMFLFGKIWKSFNAARILAQEGYGPDAMVVARSLVNGAIDLGYIVKANSEERARQWCAVGEMAQQQYREQFGGAPDRDRDLNGASIEAQAKLWRKLGIKKRAEDSGLEDLYRIAYAAGSSTEHSDSWSSIDYVEEISGGGRAFQTGPDERGVAKGLGAACWGLSEAFLRWCGFFGFDEDGAVQRVKDIADHFSESVEKRKASGGG
jgi:hypothetical protein